MIEQIYLYVSSSGEHKDVRHLDTQYLINALAKCYRDLFETKNYQLVSNIVNIQNELEQRVEETLNNEEE